MAGRAGGREGNIDERLDRALATLMDCKEDIAELRNGHRQLQVAGDILLHLTATHIRPGPSNLGSSSL